eukprot:gene529-9192_t
MLAWAAVFAEVEGWAGGDAVWWTFVTLSTIGFGDFAPATSAGRALFLPFV